MSADPFPNLERFVRGVRRRLTLLRFVERVGVAVAIASAVTLPLIGLLAWGGAGAMEPTLLCLGLGILGGIAWGASCIPTTFEAALEADRQLQWADLLGSATLLRDAPDDPWQRAVLIDAERRCGGMSPSSILLRRLSPQAWSGIGLAIALVLALAAWVGLPADSLARDTRVLTASSTAQPHDLPNQPLLVPIPIDAWRRSAAPPEGQDAAADNARPAAPDHGDGATTLARDQQPGAGADPSDGKGGVLGRTKPSVRAVARSDSPSDSVVVTGSTPNPNGRPTGGNAGSSDATAPGNGVGGTVGGTSRHRPTNQPWTASHWPSDVEAARRAISSGEVPPQFSDLVKEYFQRD